MNGQVDDRVRQAIKEAATGGRISCTEARRLAKEFKVPVRDVGSACNELKIKIRSCELGCFN